MLIVINKCIISRYEFIPEKWEVPSIQPYKVQNDLYNFWKDPDAYDQFCVAAETAPHAIQVAFWQNTLPEPTELETREVIREIIIVSSTLFNFTHFLEIAFHRHFRQVVAPRNLCGNLPQTGSRHLGWVNIRQGEQVRPEWNPIR